MTDDVLFTLRNAWLGAFPLMWLGGLAAMLALAAKAKRDPAGYKRRFMVLWCTFFVYIVGAATVSGLANGVVWRRYQRLLEAPHHAIVFYTSPRRELVDGAGQRAFIEALRSGNGVAAHHSHPIDKLEFGFDDDGRIFSVGRDSSEPDEYWIKLERSPFYGEEGTPVLRQVHSPVMAAWLARWHGEPVPRRSPGPAAKTRQRE